MDFKKVFNDLFTWQDQEEYNFELPENYSENKFSTSEEDAVVTPKNIFPSIELNLEYLKTRYNTLINSDIIIREFILLARGKQYKAFLLFIDGMVNTDLINNYVLKPLMLRNSANTFDSNEDNIISEAKTNNITVRKVKNLIYLNIFLVLCSHKIASLKMKLLKNL